MRPTISGDLYYMGWDFLNPLFQKGLDFGCAACITAAFPLLLKLSTFVLVKLKGFPIFTLDMFLAF